MSASIGESRPLLASSGSTEPRYNGYSGIPDEQAKVAEESLLRKLDLRMSILFLIYILNFVDRESVAAARLRGFEEDLKLDKDQFASILSVFYFGYMLMQIPSNMMLVHIGKPSIFLAFCTMMWGTVSFSIGLATSYHGALLLRFFLGIVEAGFYPGALYLISRWYKRSEIAQRTAYLMCGSFIGEAFGALIASGILDLMDGVLGQAAWRWLFFVEGGLTVVVAVFAMFIIPDFPETKHVSWLTPEENELARRRMIEDSDTKTTLLTGKDIIFAGFWDAVSDWKVWGMTITYYFVASAASFHIYFPTLAATLGFDAGITMLLCAPPWLFAAASTLWISRHSDKTGERCMHVVVPVAIGTVGFILSIFTMNVIIRYFSLFLMALVKTGLIGFLAWASAATSGSVAKRAVVIALVNTFGHFSNMVGSYLWKKEWGPTYKKSFSLYTVISLISITLCLFMRMNFKRLNRQMDLEDEQRRNESGSEEGLVGKNGWRYHT
ncbi:hypothetical protein NP233_g4892 [Leucocoprinus birnbaumii]|uniref:Major facilitator superfamily (MFS) profile domain-containing protein n=1 Tax=Leucocoprinus birnbaumii TaxID=56174 RepID=A0AAD5VW72_9AGAR|nr:hypothetical protein NP233_g4892 [Leucocoprinus birnbaumii]